MIKLIGGLVLALIIIGYVLSAYGQVGPCEIVTIVKDGKITNCTICGTIVNCM